jgi:hypothetical protein
MRIPLAVVALTLAVPMIAAAPASPGASPSANCPRTTISLAKKGGADSGSRIAPKKLTELPPARGYMAVYRQISGCEMPLTMVDYRNPRRR